MSEPSLSPLANVSQQFLYNPDRRLVDSGLISFFSALAHSAFCCLIRRVSVFQRYSPPRRRERGGHAEKKFKIDRYRLQEPYEGTSGGLRMTCESDD